MRQILRTICAALGYERPEISLLITDDRSIRDLNKTWRNKDKPTDVLSFSQLEGESLPGFSSLGDLVISSDTAARQAAALGHSLELEMARLLVHGVLHLLGYDHVHGGRQAARMKREEARLMRLLGKQDPAWKGSRGLL